MMRSLDFSFTPMRNLLQKNLVCSHNGNANSHAERGKKEELLKPYLKSPGAPTFNAPM